MFSPMDILEIGFFLAHATYLNFYACRVGYRQQHASFAKFCQDTEELTNLSTSNKSEKESDFNKENQQISFLNGGT